MLPNVMLITCTMIQVSYNIKSLQLMIQCRVFLCPFPQTDIYDLFLGKYNFFQTVFKKIPQLCQIKDLLHVIVHTSNTTSVQVIGLTNLWKKCKVDLNFHSRRKFRVVKFSEVLVRQCVFRDFPNTIRVFGYVL